MFNAKIFLDILKATKENKDLLKTIENILNVLPDGIIVHKQSQCYGITEVAFSNDTICKQLFEDDIVGVPLSSISLRCEIYSMDNHSMSSSDLEIFSISDVLLSNEQSINDPIEPV